MTLPDKMSTEAGFGASFYSKVKELIFEENEREKLFESLRTYQSQRELGSLLSDLRKLLNDPNKLELYEHVRPLILLKHQLEYSRKTPNMPGVKLRIVRLHRQPGESFGFAVRGGFEHGIGVFVSEVKPGSQADKRGLKVGDELIRVNGFTISEAIHEDVLNLIKSRDEIILKVTHIGMLPNKAAPSDSVTWSYVENIDSSKALQEVLDGAGNKNRLQGNELKIFINTSGATSIGCGILSGPNHFPGIFMDKVKPGSLAEEAGLEVGDQIVEVNGTTFQNISHKEAVVTLKGSKQLDMVIRKKVGMALFEKSRRNSNQTSRLSDYSEDDNSKFYRPAPPPPLPSRNYSQDEVAGTMAMDETEVIEQVVASRMKSYNNNPLPTTHTDEGQTTQGDYSTIVTSPVKKEEVDSLREELDALKQQKTALGGKAAILATRNSNLSNRPSLLGAPITSLSLKQDLDMIDNPRQLFQEEDIQGKDLKLIKLIKTKPLGIEVEGGIGTPLADRIQVSEIYTDGCVFENGEIEIGDQLMMVDGKSLLNISAAQARNILTEADNKTQNIVKIVIAKGTMLNDEDAVTFF